MSCPGEQTFCDRLIHEGCGREGPHAGIGHARHLKEALQLTVFALVAVKRQQGDIERDRLRPAEQVPLARHQQTFTVACRVQGDLRQAAADFIVRDVVRTVL